KTNGRGKAGGAVGGGEERGSFGITRADSRAGDVEVRVRRGDRRAVVGTAFDPPIDRGAGRKAAFVMRVARHRDDCCRGTIDGGHHFVEGRAGDVTPVKTYRRVDGGVVRGLEQRRSCGRTRGRCDGEAE